MTILLISKEGYEEVEQCWQCGAVVRDIATHADWHNRVEMKEYL